MSIRVMRCCVGRQGTERGAGPGGSERLAEEERRRLAERERHNSYKDFQGKVEKETEKVREHRTDRRKEDIKYKRKHWGEG